MGVETALLVGGLAVSAVGTGMQYYGAQEQAQSQKSATEYNYGVDRGNAGLALDATKLRLGGEIFDAQSQEQQIAVGFKQNDLERRNTELTGEQAIDNALAAASQSRTNAKALLQSARIQLGDAQTLKETARTVETVGRERAMRMRTESQRALGAQRAAVVKSGVAIEGSPLDLLADNAARFELGAQDTIYESRVTAIGYDKKSKNTLEEARITLLNAGQELKSGRNYEKTAKNSRVGLKYALEASDLEAESLGVAMRGAQFRESSARYGLSLAGKSYESALDEADLARMIGYSTARGSELAKWGTLISGATDVSNQLGDYYT